MAARKARSHLPTAVNDSPTPLGLAPKYMTKQEFGRRIYRLMLNKGWSQSELARAARINRDDVSRYVRGVSLPTEDKLKGLAKALGATTEELLPNFVAHAIDDDHPAFEMKESASVRGICWLRVNRYVQTKTAMDIGRLLDSDHTPANPDASHGHASSR